jgi:hypothetical protein
MGIVPSALAKKADLAPSTINRFLKEPTHTLSSRTMETLARLSGYYMAPNGEVQRQFGDKERQMLSMFCELEDQDKDAILAFLKVKVSEKNTDKTKYVSDGPSTLQEHKSCHLPKC